MTIFETSSQESTFTSRNKQHTTPDETPAILQFRVWLKGLSPMVWRRVQVPSTMTLREFHGVLQVAMGWDGIHLYQFIVHTVCYGSWELSAESADIALDALKLRKGSRFLYEYDLNIPWEHEIRLEESLASKPRTRYPCCVGGDGTCRRRIVAGLKTGRSNWTMRSAMAE